MEKTHDYKSWLSSDESTVYCEEDRDYAYIFLNSVVQKIMETKYCTIPDLIDFDCNIHRNGVKPLGYGITHGWTEDQIQRMHVATGTLGYYVWLGPPVGLDDEMEEEPEMEFAERDIDMDRCTGCQHLCVPTFYEPCKSCMRGCNFTPRNDSKGEKEMNCYEEDLMEIDRNSIIPKRIWFNEHDGKFYTTVEWEDGTKTTVTEENKEHASQYGGFTAALAKHMFGTGGTIRLMNQAIDKANEKKKLREQERERKKANEQYKRERDAMNRKLRHDLLVREALERLRAEQEAQKRLREERFQTFARELLGLKAQKKANSNVKTAKEEDHAE